MQRPRHRGTAPVDDRPRRQPEAHRLGAETPVLLDVHRLDGAADDDRRRRDDEPEARESDERDELRGEVGPAARSLDEDRAQCAGAIVDPDRGRREHRDEDQPKGLQRAERERDAPRQREVLVRALEPLRLRRELLPALRAHAVDDLRVEIRRLSRGIRGEQIVARKGAWRATLL